MVAFFSASSLSAVVFPVGSKIARISRECFLGCSAVAAVIIPSSVEVIAEFNQYIEMKV
jgi:hypothetical protein